MLLGQDASHTNSDFFCQKVQTQTVSTEKLSKTLSYEKATYSKTFYSSRLSKMLVQLATEVIVIFTNIS